MSAIKVFVIPAVSEPAGSDGHRASRVSSGATVSFSQDLSTHLRIAGSMMSGLLVAPMMKTFFLLPIPSISVRIWLMTLSEAPPASPLVPPLDLAILSNSSKNRTQGEADLNVRIFH